MNNHTDTEHTDKARLIIDWLHRMMIHYALWFTEVRHQMGLETALELEKEAFQKSFGIQINRMAKVLGFEMDGDFPKALLELSPAKMEELLDAAAVNWLANDGVWFQTVEFSHGMNDAKRCNDSCWAHFSPFEASSIRSLLSLPEDCGLEGLKLALNARLYGRINTQTIIDESPDSILFRMNVCRVQAARKRKGLDDYPCKSGGLVEYTTFAKSIDRRIKTECIGCPPDDHPDEWFCAWRFSIRKLPPDSSAKA